MPSGNARLRFGWPREVTASTAIGRSDEDVTPEIDADYWDNAERTSTTLDDVKLYGTDSTDINGFSPNYHEMVHEGHDTEPEGEVTMVTRLWDSTDINGPPRDEMSDEQVAETGVHSSESSSDEDMEDEAESRFVDMNCSVKLYRKCVLIIVCFNI
jgi:hypothetical protein